MMWFWFLAHIGTTTATRDPAGTPLCLPVPPPAPDAGTTRAPLRFNDGAAPLGDSVRDVRRARSAAIPPRGAALQIDGQHHRADGERG